MRTATHLLPILAVWIGETACQADGITIHVCARGDRSELASRLMGGRLDVQFTNALGEAVGTGFSAGLDHTTRASEEPPDDATGVIVRALSSEEATIAHGSAELSDDGATCVCLALDHVYSTACASVLCRVADDSCQFFDDSGQSIDPATRTFGSGPNADFAIDVTDTTLRWDAPTNSYSSESVLGVDADPAKVALIRMDLSSLPTSSEIDQATLWIRVCDDPENCPSSSSAIVAYELLETWDQTATWEDRIAGTPWASPGASGASRSSQQRGSQADLATAGQYRPLELDVNLLHLWVSEPGTNLGLALTTDGESGIDLDSSEAEPTKRPYLELVYRIGRD